MHGVPPNSPPYSIDGDELEAYQLDLLENQCHEETLSDEKHNVTPTSPAAATCSNGIVLPRMLKSTTVWRNGRVVGEDLETVRHLAVAEQDACISIAECGQTARLAVHQMHTARSSVGAHLSDLEAVALQDCTSSIAGKGGHLLNSHSSMVRSNCDMEAAGQAQQLVMRVSGATAAYALASRPLVMRELNKKKSGALEIRKVIHHIRSVVQKKLKRDADTAQPGAREQAVSIARAARDLQLQSLKAWRSVGDSGAWLGSPTKVMRPAGSFLLNIQTACCAAPSATDEKAVQVWAFVERDRDGNAIRSLPRRFKNDSMNVLLMLNVTIRAANCMSASVSFRMEAIVSRRVLLSSLCCVNSSQAEVMLAQPLSGVCVVGESSAFVGEDILSVKALQFDIDAWASSQQPVPVKSVGKQTSTTRPVLRPADVELVRSLGLRFVEAGMLSDSDPDMVARFKTRVVARLPKKKSDTVALFDVGALLAEDEQHEEEERDRQKRKREWDVNEHRAAQWRNAVDTDETYERRLYQYTQRLLWMSDNGAFVLGLDGAPDWPPPPKPIAGARLEL